MDKVRIGIIGIGNMGTAHARYILNGEVAGAKLGAVCDTDPERIKWAKQFLSDDVKIFDNTDDLFKSGSVDAIMIATPHYDHPTIAIGAFEHNLHVLCEKPAGVYTKQVREMNEAAEKTDRVFSMMYNQRTNPIYQKVRDLVQSGELGEIKRTIWIITNWYRSQSYYDSGGWRATWAGEGGGVLLNQDPHQLDLWQWMTGMPKRVRAFCAFGKYHDIEVEDDVTAYVEYENGATGLFVTSTGEAPGTNRFEVSADRGKLVVERDKLTFWRLRTPERQFNREYKGAFGQPECWECDIPIRGVETAHKGITQNWVNAILKGEELIAPGVEGIKGLEISNAMHLSTWIDDWVDIPVDEELFYTELKKRIDSSTYVKTEKRIVSDLDGTY
ncbi:MAG: Gfo/Idh/MocA family oxidoreductase [Clostridiales bacterium]|nr:Gfo/Idh/MocA family oxidoreductase [Clostridiales bacterium]